MSYSVRDACEKAVVKKKLFLPSSRSFNLLRKRRRDGELGIFARRALILALGVDRGDVVSFSWLCFSIFENEVYMFYDAMSFMSEVFQR